MHLQWTESDTAEGTTSITISPTSDTPPGPPSGLVLAPGVAPIPPTPGPTRTRTTSSLSFSRSTGAKTPRRQSLNVSTGMGSGGGGSTSKARARTPTTPLTPLSNSRTGTPAVTGSGTATGAGAGGRVFGRAAILTAPPRVVAVIDTPDVAVGAVDPRKRRVVTATRFSSRAGADRRVSCGFSFVLWFCGLGLNGIFYFGRFSCRRIMLRGAFRPLKIFRRWMRKMRMWTRLWALM